MTETTEKKGKKIKKNKISKIKKTRNKSRNGKTLRLILLCILTAVVVFALFFFLYFRVEHVDVEGNEKYTDEEISGMVFDGFLSKNTIWMSGVKKKLDLSDKPFMDSVEIEYLDRNSLRLHVSEKYPIGYIEYEGGYYYFDVEGMVLEEKSPEDVAKEALEKTAASLSGSTDGEQADEAQSDSGVAVYHPKLEDVPKINGLVTNQLALNKNLGLKDEKILKSLSSLIRICDKFEIMPDSVDVSESEELTLHYGNVRALLGSDTLLEDKLTQLAGILPNLNGMSGELALNDYEKTTQNIYFRKDE